VVTTIAVADWNLGPDEVEALARRVGGQFHYGRHPDHAIVKGAQRVSVRNLGRNGSDHDALLYRMVLPDRLGHRDGGGEEFRVLLWNVYVGQSTGDLAVTLANLIDRHEPHLVALSEAYKARGVLGAVPGYRRVQGLSPFGESRDCAVLIRRDLTVIRKGFLFMKEPWIGPKHGLRKKPRRYVRVRVRTKSSQTVRLLSAHLPFGEKPRAESLARIAAWFKHR
jgi:hypothetical protein